MELLKKSLRGNLYFRNEVEIFLITWKFILGTLTTLWMEDANCCERKGFEEILEQNFSKFCALFSEPFSRHLSDASLLPPAEQGNKIVIHKVFKEEMRIGEYFRVFCSDHFYAQARPFQRKFSKKILF